MREGASHPQQVNRREFRIRHVLRGHDAPIRWTAWSTDGLKLATCSEDQTVRIWELETAKLEGVLRGVDVYCLTWSPDGTRVAFSCLGDQIIRLWHILDEKRGKPVETLTKPEKHTDHESISSGGARPPNYYSRGVPPADVNPLASRRAPAPQCVSWSPSGRLIALSADLVVNLYYAHTGRLFSSLHGHGSRVTGLAWSSDSKRLVSCSDDSTLRIWDIETGSSTTLRGHKGSVTSVAWSPRDPILASCSKDRTIRLWDAEQGSESRVLEGHTDEVTILSFMADGCLLASKALDKTLRLWRWQTGDLVSILDEPLSGMALALNPRFPVAASSAESEIVLWDIDTEAHVAQIAESVRYTTAKIALVGESGVGKTGMGWRLAHGEFRNHPSSHGQQFWIVPELAKIRADGTLCEAVLWDFAGQPDYRITHALFLDDVDLALVLFDPSKRQDALNGVVYWLKQLAFCGRHPQTILVGARIDCGPLTLPSEELEQFCQSQEVTGGFVLTSALTGEGIPELLDRVRSQIRWDSLIPTVTTATFKRLKEYVLGLKQSIDQKNVLVTPGALHAMVQATQPDERFSDAELVTTLKHLENHGYLTFLRRSSGEETILLAPDLLINLASSFPLEARRNPKGLGVLDEARILGNEYNFPETGRLEQQDAEVLLDAATARFLAHNLCFRETFGDQTLLVFPSLINQKRPPREDIATVEGFSYIVTGSIEHVYPSLVVLLGYTNTFSRTHQWQHQAQYQMKVGEICGFRQIGEREGEMELELYYGPDCPAETKVLFQSLFERFLRQRDVTVTKFPPVDCPRCNYRQPRNEVVKRLRSTKAVLCCCECAQIINLRQYGEEIKLSKREQERVELEQALTQSRTWFETALVRVKACVRDRGGQNQPPSCFLSYSRGEREFDRWVGRFASDLKKAGIVVVFDEWDDLAIGESTARFINLIVQSTFVIVVGTPEYRLKFENNSSSRGNMVAAEFDLIQLRLTRREVDKKTVLPVLLDGEPENSFPPLLQGRRYCDMRREESYLEGVFQLILTIHRIPFNDPVVMSDGS